jgi:hypothetical protein
MSKLTNLIEVTQTGRVKLHPANPVCVVTEGLNNSLDYSRLAHKEYRLEVKLSTKGFAKDETEIVHLKNMCKRQIVSFVFDEFGPLIRKIERHLYNLEIDDAKTALRELENEMMS